MKKWMHLGFVGLCTAVLLVLWNAPEVSTPRLPRDDSHGDRKAYAGCPACHETGSGAPMTASHLGTDGNLRPDHQKCYFCHKPQDD